MEKAPIQTSFFICKSPFDDSKFLIFLAFAKVLSKLKLSSGRGEVVTQSVLGFPPIIILTSGPIEQKFPI